MLTFYPALRFIYSLLYRLVGIICLIMEIPFFFKVHRYFEKINEVTSKMREWHKTAFYFVYALACFLCPAIRCLLRTCWLHSMSGDGTSRCGSLCIGSLTFSGSSSLPSVHVFSFPCPCARAGMARDGLLFCVCARCVLSAPVPPAHMLLSLASSLYTRPYVRRA